MDAQCLINGKNPGEEGGGINTKNGNRGGEEVP